MAGIAEFICEIEGNAHQNDTTVIALAGSKLHPNVMLPAAQAVEHSPPEALTTSCGQKTGDESTSELLLCAMFVRV